MSSGSQAQRHIFITGGASGIGRAVAIYFAKKGWFVTATDVNASGLEETLGLIDGDAKFSKLLDVRDRDAWDEALKLGEKHGYRNAQTTVIAPT